MTFDMKVPCPDCPFRKEGGIPLRQARVREIAGMMLDSQGGTFPCHRSIDYSDEDVDTRLKAGEVHCAGALAFALKQGNSTQMMRIAGRLGCFDPDVIEKVSGGLVWDSTAQWLKAVRGALKRLSR